MLSALVLPEQTGFNVFSKPCLILCSHECPKPNLSLANVFIPKGSLLVKVFFSTGLIKFNNTFGNTL